MQYNYYWCIAGAVLNVTPLVAILIIGINK